MIWILVTFINNCSMAPIQACETLSRKQHWTWPTHSPNLSSLAQITRRTICLRLPEGKVQMIGFYSINHNR